MHDFCFTIPYGLLILVGGLVGYARRGSTASLAGGAGSGLLLLLAGFVSLKAFEKRRNSSLALILETVCALILAYVMGQRYLETFKIMPAGVVAALRCLIGAIHWSGSATTYLNNYIRMHTCTYWLTDYILFYNTYVRHRYMGNIH
ncbi:protein FATTY ACID EXPORT 5-like isoform X1 [Phoenix dactylifera]|uniref:Protein FATTY ACID EXPORT 5-like isoform X1 n=1 Tax=Phoenix dactylifera TaxID=42345 RepID=A0A8B9AM22_PHODC|nr:protein FATTY ACID EXPORT 5-like isoform X1 [Phoenix dactylifera]